VRESVGHMFGMTLLRITKQFKAEIGKSNRHLNK